MNKSIKRIIILTKRNIKEIVREPISIVFMLGLPLVMEILFYYLFHELTSQFEMKYLAPGIVVFSQAFLTLFTGLLLSLDRNSSFLTRLFVTDTKAFEFILSYALAILPLTIIQSILFFVVGIIIDSSIFSIYIIPTILLSILTSLLFIGFGILFGSLCSEKSIGGVASIIICGQSVLSGMWFPIEGLSANLIKIMDILPFRNATYLLQSSLSGNFEILNYLLVVIFYEVIVFIMAVMFFKRKMIVK